MPSTLAIRASARAQVCLGCFLAITLTATSGCGSREPEFGAVKGRVTVGDKPLARGRILFLPVGPSTGATVSAVIRDGEYSIPLSERLVVGESRIEVDGAPDLGFELDDEEAFAKRGGAPMPPNPIPKEFNRKSILRAPVKPGENILNVAIP